MVSCGSVEFWHHRPRVSPCQPHVIVKHKARRPCNRCTQNSPAGQSCTGWTANFLLSWNGGFIRALYCYLSVQKWRANEGNEAFLKHPFFFYFNSKHGKKVLSAPSSQTLIDFHNAQPPETFCARRHAERGCLLCWIYLRINNFYWNHRCYFQSLNTKKKSSSLTVLPD